MDWWGKFRGATLVGVGSYIISDEVIQVSNNYPSGNITINVGTLLISVLCLYLGVRLIFSGDK